MPLGIRNDPSIHISTNAFFGLRRGFWAVITCIRPSGPHGVQQNGYEITEAVPKKKNKAWESEFYM